jgi:hypothetical protein
VADAGLDVEVGAAEGDDSADAEPEEDEPEEDEVDEKEADEWAADEAFALAVESAGVVWLARSARATVPAIEPAARTAVTVRALRNRRWRERAEFREAGIAPIVKGAPGAELTFALEITGIRTASLAPPAAGPRSRPR